MKKLPVTPEVRTTFRVCMRHAHAKLLYAAEALMLIIITIEITNYWSGKCLTCCTGSDAPILAVSCGRFLASFNSYSLFEIEIFS